MRRRAPFLAFAVGAALFLSGCANRGLVRFDKLAQRAAGGEYLEAAAAVRAAGASLYGDKSRLLYNMDLGLLYHYAGRHDSSIVYFERAARVHEALYTRSVSNEAASLLVNDNVRPYRGRPHEMVWLRVFQAFNYLALGDLDGARVEMRQAQLLMDAFRGGAGSGEDAYRDDPLYRGVAALVYDALDERDDAAISAYHAVKAYRDRHARLPDGLEALSCRLLRAADRADDLRLLELDCPSSAPGLPRKVAAPAGGSAPDADAPRGEIVVIGELGRAPALGETAFQGTWIRDGILVYHYRDADGKTVTDALPAPGLPPEEAEKAGKGGRTRSGTTLSIKWAMPSLREIPFRSRTLKVAGADLPAAAGEAWGDAGELLRRDLAENRTTLLLRTVTRVVVRTLATEKAKSELRTDNPFLNLLTNLGADFLSGQLEQADVRSWFLLPRTVQVARLSAPAGRHTLQIGATDSEGRTVEGEAREVEVRAGRTTFVFFNSLK